MLGPFIIIMQVIMKLLYLVKILAPNLTLFDKIFSVAPAETLKKNTTLQLHRT